MILLLTAKINERIIFKTYLQCETTHSLLQYSLSQSGESTAGLEQPFRRHVGTDDIISPPPI